MKNTKAQYAIIRNRSASGREIYEGVARVGACVTPAHIKGEWPRHNVFFAGDRTGYERAVSPDDVYPTRSAALAAREQERIA